MYQLNSRVPSGTSKAGSAAPRGLDAGRRMGRQVARVGHGRLSLQPGLPYLLLLHPLCLLLLLGAVVRHRRGVLHVHLREVRRRHLGGSANDMRARPCDFTRKRLEACRVGHVIGSLGSGSLGFD